MITQVSDWSECCMHAPSHAGADAVNTPCALNRFDAEGLDANRGVCTPSDGGGTTCLPCGGRGRFGPGPLQCCPFDKTGCGTFLLGFCSDDRECVTCGTAGDDYSSDAPCCPRAQLLSAVFEGKTVGGNVDTIKMHDCALLAAQHCNVARQQCEPVADMAVLSHNRMLHSAQKQKLLAAASHHLMECRGGCAK